MVASPLDIVRRTFLKSTGVGLGSIALSSLLASDATSVDRRATWSGVVNPLHLRGRIARKFELTNTLWVYNCA
jgi:hypothetical protein